VHDGEREISSGVNAWTQRAWASSSWYMDVVVGFGVAFVVGTVPHAFPPSRSIARRRLRCGRLVLTQTYLLFLVCPLCALILIRVPPGKLHPRIHRGRSPAYPELIRLLSVYPAA
jgi:hypothetical protein